MTIIEATNRIGDVICIQNRIPCKAGDERSCEYKGVYRGEQMIIHCLASDINNQIKVWLANAVVYEGSFNSESSLKAIYNISLSVFRHMDRHIKKIQYGKANARSMHHLLKEVKFGQARPLMAFKNENDGWKCK